MAISSMLPWRVSWLHTTMLCWGWTSTLRSTEGGRRIGILALVLPEKARQLAGSTEPGDRLGEGTEQAAALDVSDVQPSSGSYLTDSESLPQEFSRLADFLTISKALDSLIARDGAESGIRKVLRLRRRALAQRVYVLAADGEQGVLAFREADGSCGSVLDRDSELDSLRGQVCCRLCCEHGQSSGGGQRCSKHGVWQR